MITTAQVKQQHFRGGKLVVCYIFQHIIKKITNENTFHKKKISYNLG